MRDDGCFGFYVVARKGFGNVEQGGGRLFVELPVCGVFPPAQILQGRLVGVGVVWSWLWFVSLVGVGHRLE